MWTRKELKARGKAAFTANYWKCVLVALLMGLLLGGGVGAVGNSTRNLNLNLNQPQSQIQSQPEVHPSAAEIIGGSDSSTGIVVNGERVDSIDQLPQEIQDVLSKPSTGEPDLTVLVPALVVLGGIILLVIAVCEVVDILVMNPLEVGCRSFFRRNAQGEADLNEIGYGFKDWGRSVKTMFLKDLFCFLWGLLFLIPGIVKSYSYRLVPYIVADQPELESREVLNLSRRLMRGHKWQTFVLDLSFLGWDILSGLTAGLLGVFYVNPYKEATRAELYLALRDGQ